MEFKEFRNLMQKHVTTMFETDLKLFIADVDKDELWDLYLDSFPIGTNEIFRERREHDCSCCKQFIRNFGNVVILKNNEPVSIWDFITNESTYQPVINALSSFIKKVTSKMFLLLRIAHLVWNRLLKNLNLVILNLGIILE